MHMQSEITIKLKYHYKCARALYKSSLYLKPDALLQVCCKFAARFCTAEILNATCAMQLFATII